MSENNKSNKVEIKIILTCEQKKDFLKALNHIIRQGAKDEGRALQLMAIDYLSGQENV
jgi:hypothetical protein